MAIARALVIFVSFVANAFVIFVAQPLPRGQVQLRMNVG
jgi:hypothetical protein